MASSTTKLRDDIGHIVLGQHKKTVSHTARVVGLGFITNAYTAPVHPVLALDGTRIRVRFGGHLRRFEPLAPEVELGWGGVMNSSITDTRGHAQAWFIETEAIDWADGLTLETLLTAHQTRTAAGKLIGTTTQVDVKNVRRKPNDTMSEMAHIFEIHEATP